MEKANVYSTCRRVLREEWRLIVDIRVGDIVRMKKGHPCGSNEWEIMRVGIDFRLRCSGCGHQIMIPRKQAEKNIRKVFRDGAEVNVQKK